MSRLFYILDENRNVVPTDSVLVWGEFFKQNEKRRVAFDELPGGITVSTVFLGVDHGWDPDKPPVLWETMVFGTAEGEEMDRCAGTWEQAEAMHAAMVQRVKQSLKETNK